MQSFVDGVEETVSQISDSVPKVFTFCSEGLERCIQLTEGWGLPGLIRAVEVCVCVCVCGRVGAACACVLLLIVIETHLFASKLFSKLQLSSKLFSKLQLYILYF